MRKNRGLSCWTAMIVVAVVVGGLSLARRTASAAETWVLGDPIYNNQGQIIGWYCAGDCTTGSEWCCKRIS